jgi:hypothetical protein
MHARKHRTGDDDGGGGGDGDGDGTASEGPVQGEEELILHFKSVPCIHRLVALSLSCCGRSNAQVSSSLAGNEYD